MNNSANSFQRGPQNTLLPSAAWAVILVLVLGTSTAHSQDATEIVRRAVQNMQGETSVAEITMNIIRPTWERSLSLKAWSKGQDYSLIVVTDPPREEGTAFLKRDNEIWNWLPDINRTIKLPPSMMSQSWMGSDFNNNDLIRESSVLTDYTHTLGADSILQNMDCYRVRMTPMPDAPVVWGEVVAFISKEEFLQLQTAFYDEEGNLVKVMKGSQVKEMGGRILPSRLEMIPMAGEDKKTVLFYHHIDFNVDLDNRFFSIQNLKRVH